MKVLGTSPPRQLFSGMGVLYILNMSILPIWLLGLGRFRTQGRSLFLIIFTNIHLDSPLKDTYVSRLFIQPSWDRFRCKDWEKDPDLTLLMTTQLFPYHEVSDPLFPYRVQMYLYPTLHQHKRLNRTGLPVVSHWLCCLTFVVRSKDWIDGTWKHISVFGSPVSLSKLVICLWLYFWNTNTLVSLDKFYHHH